jgi:hypothetical protein
MVCIFYLLNYIRNNEYFWGLENQLKDFKNLLNLIQIDKFDYTHNKNIK